MPVELRKSLKRNSGPRTKCTRARLFKKQIKFVTANIRRAAKELREEHGVTYGGVRGYGYLKKLVIKGYGD